jgi:protein SCO1/2
MRTLAAWAAVGLGIASVGGFVALRHAVRPAALPVYGRLPAFQLEDQRAGAFTAESMRGHVSVVDFIFTRCASSCPLLTARMAELQRRLASTGSDVRLVSFSVDPENDTPAVLEEYGARAHADPSRWRFVTGPYLDVEKAITTGFHMSAEKRMTGANDYDVIHGDWFVLVDREGDIRGYYPVQEAPEFDRLVEATLRLEVDSKR